MSMHGPATAEDPGWPETATLLESRDRIDRVDLRAAYPWPATGGWVRGMMVATLDGASHGADGRSGSISSRADRTVLAAVRRYCDAILVGAATFRAERYRPQVPGPQTQAERANAGLGPAPRLVLVSGSLDLPWEEDAFRESTIPPLVVTVGSAGADALKIARRHAEVAVLPGLQVQPADLVQLLRARRLDRVVCEGGPRLLAAIARAGLLDELDLALSPLLVGGGQVALGEPSASPQRFQPLQVIAADGFLFIRYLRINVTAEPTKGSP